jgi:hypothetical protein
MAKEKALREEVEVETAASLQHVAQPPVTEDTIVRNTIVKPDIPRHTIVAHTRPRRTIASSGKTPVEVDAGKGYFAYYNDLSDRVIPELKLDPFAQVVLHRLYRLSRGWKSEECTVSLAALADRCVMSKTTVQKSINVLIGKNLIEDLGASKKGDREGKRYKVLPGLSPIAPRTIVQGTIVTNEQTIVPESTKTPGTIAAATTIKNNTNTLLTNTSTNTSAVRVGSRFSLQECRRFAEHLSSSGQGINNPGGYATKIHRSGEADELIATFLNPTEPLPTVDTSQCPDCRGTGFWEPGGAGKGVAKCKHEKLEPQQTRSK